MHPLERALRLTVRWVVPAFVLSPILLAVPEPDDPFGLFTVHLGLVVLFGLALALRLAVLASDSAWFAGTEWSMARRRLAAGAALVALDTGAVALLTLASSAALRFEPSLQFLQLLSTLDIAWAGAAIIVGATLRWGMAAARVGGGLLGIFCMFAIWRYLDIVGFTETGGWVVSGSDLMRYVIPFDMVAAVVAIVVLVAGAHSVEPTEHARAQS